MTTVGVVGASGFIGNRTVEMFDDDGLTVRPILRAESSRSRLSRPGLDCRIANALDQGGLRRAFDGCEVVVHSVLGSAGMIRGSAAPAYRAAQAAGVRRLIYLSTMCVHGQAPRQGTDESSPLDKKGHDFPYNAAKIDAERQLLLLRKRGDVEVVIFRPGIVFGPRSRWITGIADELLKGTAGFIDQGRGICNTTYVDNLVQAMHLAISSLSADREAFFIGENEIVTWADFYGFLATGLGLDISQVPTIDTPQFSKGSLKKRMITAVWDSVPAQKLLSLMSEEQKQKLKGTNKKQRPSPPPLVPPLSTPIVWKPEISREMAALQQSRFKLPLQKAKSLLGYEPKVSFTTACLHSLIWLADSGYPVAVQYTKPENG